MPLGQGEYVITVQAINTKKQLRLKRVIPAIGQENFYGVYVKAKIITAM